MDMPTIILFICFAALFICSAKSSADIMAPIANSAIRSQVVKGYREKRKAPVTTNCVCQKKTYCVANTDADTDRLLEYVKVRDCYDFEMCFPGVNPYPVRFRNPYLYNSWGCRDPEYVRLQVSSYINRQYQSSGDCPSEIGHVITKDPCNGNPQYRIPQSGTCYASDSCICLFCPARN